METNNSAGTESDIVSTRLIHTLTGHVNRRNFVGLAASSDGKSGQPVVQRQMRCLYTTRIYSTPLATVSFDKPGMLKSSSRDNDSGNHFVSVVLVGRVQLISANL